MLFALIDLQEGYSRIESPWSLKNGRQIEPHRNTIQNSHVDQYLVQTQFN